MARTHKMKLDAAPFDATRSGKKTIEIRLNDSKRKNITVGDLIEFEQVNSGDVLTTKVISIRHYESLLALTSSESFQKTGGIYRDKGHWLKSINLYYSQDEQVKYGLVAFELEVTSQ